MKIAVLGAGRIGGTVARQLVDADHQVFMGLRDPGAPHTVAGLTGVRTGTPEQAVEWGEVALLAVPGDAVEQVTLRIAPGLRGKTVIDATNPYGVHLNGLTEGQRLQQLLPHSAVVRAFNSLHWETLRDRPSGPATRIVLPLSGDDLDAKRTVAQLIQDCGFEPLDLGALAAEGPQDPGGSLYNVALSREAALAVLS